MLAMITGALPPMQADVGDRQRATRALKSCCCHPGAASRISARLLRLNVHPVLSCYQDLAILDAEVRRSAVSRSLPRPAKSHSSAGQVGSSACRDLTGEKAATPTAADRQHPAY